MENLMKQYSISRDDSVYECFPDLTRTKSGKLICVFRESEHHGKLNGSRLVYTESLDEGKTWSEKKALTPRMCEAFAYNCPRISTLPSGEIVIICDVLDRSVDEDLLKDCVQHVFTSTDDGNTWSAPRTLDIQGIVPDKYQVLSCGRHIFGVHRRDPETKTLTQYGYFSDDGGKTWTETIIAKDARYELCEVSIVEMENGILVAFMRENSGLGICCMKAISKDYGATWEGVYETNIDACHRPVVGKCENGKFLMTYRFMQGGKGWLGAWTQNLFGAFLTKESALATTRKGHTARIFPISFDRSPKSDMGYSGWVELSKNRFYVVNYLLDDAPKAQIRGYEFEKTDVILE